MTTRGYGKGRVWSDLGTRPPRTLALFIDTPDARLRLVRAAQLPCFGRAGGDPNADGVYSYRTLWIQSHGIGFTSPEGICSLVDSRLGASTSPPLFATKRGPSILDRPFLFKRGSASTAA
jgi:hypothetical protein